MPSFSSRFHVFEINFNILLHVFEINFRSNPHVFEIIDKKRRKHRDLCSINKYLIKNNFRSPVFANSTTIILHHSSISPFRQDR